MTSENDTGRLTNIIMSIKKNVSQPSDLKFKPKRRKVKKKVDNV
jgi:hypothetical protein